MKTICLVTNYNYANYLPECLTSIAAQTKEFDRIVIVDDGSTDGSREVIDRFCAGRTDALPIYKQNGGQLSCFHAALEFVEADDYVFFMDADDAYPSDYLQRVSPFIVAGKSDFVFVNPVRFHDGELPPRTACIGPDKSFAFSSTSALTRKTLCWVGAATSCIAMRGSLLRTLLPYPHEKDWVTRADDVLIYGASIIGAHKLYVESLGVGYRIHAENKFAGRELSRDEKADWRLRHERLSKWYADRSGLPARPPLKNVLHEAALIPGSIRKRFGIPSPAVLFTYDILLVIPMIRLLCRDLAGNRQ